MTNYLLRTLLLLGLMLFFSAALHTNVHSTVP